MNKLTIAFVGLLAMLPAGLSAQGKYLKPGFGLHLSPWVAPTHVPPKARSLQPQRASRPRQMRCPAEFTPLEAKAAFAAIEGRSLNRGKLWARLQAQSLSAPPSPGALEAPLGLPAGFRAVKNSSIRPPPAL